ncbi:hypothetical protein OY671_009460, partial [Metschnikowia pulcherrima]
MKRAKLNQHHHITREQSSVRDHMTHISRRLNDVRFIEFGDSFMERVREGAPAAVVVVHFIAMSESARESSSEITQAEPYAPIYDKNEMSSAAVPDRKPMTSHRLREMHAKGEKITMSTAYDATFARSVDEAGVDTILVGDSSGMSVQGHSSTVPVSIEDM